MWEELVALFPAGNTLTSVLTLWSGEPAWFWIGEALRDDVLSCIMSFCRWNILFMSRSLFIWSFFVFQGPLLFLLIPTYISLFIWSHQQECLLSLSLSLLTSLPDFLAGLVLWIFLGELLTNSSSAHLFLGEFVVAWVETSSLLAVLPIGFCPFNVLGLLPFIGGLGSGWDDGPATLMGDFFEGGMAFFFPVSGPIFDSSSFSTSPSLFLPSSSSLVVPSLFSSSLPSSSLSTLTSSLSSETSKYVAFFFP